MAYVSEIKGPRSFAPSAPEELTDQKKTESEKQVGSFWSNILSFLPGSNVPDDLNSDKSFMIVSGWVVEVAEVEGKRDQVVSFQLSGDVIYARPEGCNRRFIALTKVEVGNIDLLRGDEGAPWKQKISRAERHVEELLFNHLVRMGRLNAEERLLHLLLEFNDRLEAAGLVKGASYRLPVTQQMLGDALGLSLVHINRTLQELRRRKLVTLRRGHVTLHDRGRLASMACYEPCGPDAGSSPARAELARSAQAWSSCIQAAS